MQVLLLALAFALPLTAAGCSSASDDLSRPAGGSGTAGGGAHTMHSSRTDDSDSDGLCDATELRARTNPTLLDTDADGFPDVVELLANYPASDPGLPGPDQVSYLVGRPGHVLDLELRATVDGNGQSATGEFMDRGAWDVHALTARDFFVSAVAVEATPPDNVRGISAGEEHFRSVLGRTRLTFRLHFEFTSDISLDCAPALPFRYAIKGDTGGYMASRDYLLVVTPDESQVGPEDFCRPIACL